MTCPGCDRDVTLVGGLCGHCSRELSSAVADALEEVDVVDGVVEKVFRASDDRLHVVVDDGGAA